MPAFDSTRAPARCWRAFRWWPCRLREAASSRLAAARAATQGSASIRSGGHSRRSIRAAVLFAGGDDWRRPDRRSRRPERRRTAFVDARAVCDAAGAAPRRDPFSRGRRAGAGRRGGGRARDGNGGADVADGRCAGRGRARHASAGRRWPRPRSGRSSRRTGLAQPVGRTRAGRARGAPSGASRCRTASRARRSASECSGTPPRRSPNW